MGNFKTRTFADSRFNLKSITNFIKLVFSVANVKYTPLDHIRAVNIVSL